MSLSRHPSLSEPESERLIEEISRSRSFRGSSRATDLLRLLLKHRGGPPLSTQELAERLYGKGPTQSPDRIRMLMSRLRQTLIEYNASDGRRSPFKIELPATRGGYQIEITPNLAWKYDASLLWEPYSDSSPVDIVIPQLLVFKQAGKDSWVRYQDINNSGDIMAKTAKGSKTSINGAPTYSFVSAGEVRAAFLVADILRGNGLKPNLTMISEPSFFGGLRNSNLVVLGDPRANPLLRLVEDRMPLRSQADGIAGPEVGQKAKLFRNSDDSDHPHSYVLLTRRRRTGPHGAVATAFASASGNAIAAVIAALADREMMARIVDAIGGTGENGLPSSFQALFEVKSFRGFGEEHVAGECSLIEQCVAEE